MRTFSKRRPATAYMALRSNNMDNVRLFLRQKLSLTVLTADCFITRDST